MELSGRVGGEGAAVTSSVLVAGDAPIVRVARTVVAVLAPEETGEAFEAAVIVWMHGRRGRSRGSASVGFGIDGAMVSEVVLGVLGGAFLEVLGKEALTRTSRWRGRRRRTRASAHAAMALPVPAGLTGQQLVAVHDACIRHATTLGADRSAAVLLADAVIGAIGGGSASGGTEGS